MTFDEYQMKCRETAIYNMYIMYPTLGLCGEVGELANKIKKIYRDSNGNVSKEMNLDLMRELGDILWYVASLASDLGINLNSVADENLRKLSKRKLENKIKGSGDNR